MEQVVEHPPLEVFWDCGDEALKAVVSGHSGDGLGLDLGIVEVFSNFKWFYASTPKVCSVGTWLCASASVSPVVKL